MGIAVPGVFCGNTIEGFSSISNVHIIGLSPGKCSTIPCTIDVHQNSKEISDLGDTGSKTETTLIIRIGPSRFGHPDGLRPHQVLGNFIMANALLRLNVKKEGITNITRIVNFRSPKIQTVLNDEIRIVERTKCAKIKLGFTFDNGKLVNVR